MFIRVPKFLNEEHLRFMDQVIATADFREGAATAGGLARAVKNNLQMDIQSNEHRDELFTRVNQLILTNRVTRSSIMPRRMSLPVISQYKPGMTYGWHIDNPIMYVGAHPMRADVACTVFLNNSSDYDGGVLTVNSPAGDVSIRLEQGDAVFYPANNRHQVTEVTRGTRHALVFWIQSMIQDSAKRELMWELEIACEKVRRDTPESEALLSIQKAQTSLLRMWSDL
ncbi:MAG: Fe2+-dependent dioxygenase [Pseudohongiellaceae bacterium]